MSRYIVGQARTYIRCDSTDPSQIDVAQAIRSLHEGRVLVSYGLVADIKVAGKYGPGDLVPGNIAAAEAGLDVEIRVMGPEWTSADNVMLFANGTQVRSWGIATPAAAGIKWEGGVTLPRPKHDLWLVAVAFGPGVTKPFWPLAKPYQPTSPQWQPYVLGVSGPVRIDADQSGQFDSAYEYASRIVKDYRGDLGATVVGLKGYDQATAAQAAAMLRSFSYQDFESGWDQPSQEPSRTSSRI